MGGKTSTSTQSVNIPPEVLARYNAVNARAEDVAQRPFQQYGTDANAFVAPLSQTQQAGIAGTTAAAGAAQPYYQAATGMAFEGSGATNVGPLTGQDISRYSNPFVESVVQPTARLLRQQQEQQMSGQTANAIRSGAFGGDRAGIAAANLAGQQGLAYAGAINPLYSRSYEQGLATAQQQQGLDLQQQQANLARRQQGAQTVAGLGAGAQTAALQGAAAQIQAGQQQQQTEQAGKQALYNQFLQQQGYPFQVAQFLANIAMGTGALSGSTTTTTQPAPFFSDRRLKRDIHRIGETDDGMPIYKFKYKGDPREQTHIGLMAQDVEKTRPEAVGVAGGYKTVDYDRATRASGGLVPSSEGGGVWPEMAGEGYADGGMPQLDIFGGGTSRIPAGVLAQMQNSPRRQLMTPSMGLKPQSTGFADAMAEAQKALSAGDTLTKLYSGVKTGLVGSAPTKQDPEGFRGLFANTGQWGDTTGGLLSKAGGGSVDPYDPDEKRPDFMTSVLREGKIDTQSLPKPGQLPSQKSGLGELASGLGAVKTLYDVGSTLAPMASTAASSIAEFLPLLLLKNGGRVGYATDGYVDPDLPAEGAQEAGLTTKFKIPEEYAPIIERASRETGIPPAIIAAKIMRESGFNPAASGTVGEVGLAQVKPSTARRPGFGVAPVEGDLRDPETNIMFGARYLAGRGKAAGVKDWEDPEQAARGLAAYNSGSRAPEYAQDVLALVRNDAGEPMGVMPPARRVTPGVAGPGYVEDTPRTSPFKLFADRALAGRDMKPETKEALTSENLWVPLLSGLGSMLGSPSITLGGAIGHGLMGGTKAYTDLAKAQQEMGESRSRTEKTMADISGGALTVVDGRLMLRVARPGGGYTLVEYNAIRNMSPADRAKYNIDPRLIEDAEKFIESQGGRGPEKTSLVPKAPEAPKAPEPAPAKPDTRLPHEKEPPAATVERPTSVGGISLTPEQVKQARAITQERAGFGEKERMAEPDYFKPQYEIARGSENAKQQLIPLAGALAALPREKSIQTSGAVQSVVGPAMAVVNNLGSMLGYKFQTNDPFALQEEIDKLTTRLRAQQVSDAQQRALGALQELAKGLPTYRNSPGGQAKLVPQLLTENQREIDRQNFFRAWENAAAGDRGQNAQYAKLSSRDANEAFEKEFTESARAKESAALERMFNDTFSIKDPATGQQKKISAIEYITKYGSTMSPAQKQSFRERYGKDMKHDVLRYFGVQ